MPLREEEESHLDEESSNVRGPTEFLRLTSVLWMRCVLTERPPPAMGGPAPCSAAASGGQWWAEQHATPGKYPQ